MPLFGLISKEFEVMITSYWLKICSETTYLSESTKFTTLLYLVILLWKNASYSKEKRFCMIKLFCERLLNISSFVCKKNYDHSSYTSRAMASFQKFCLKSCKSRAMISNHHGSLERPPFRRFSRIRRGGLLIPWTLCGPPPKKKIYIYIYISASRKMKGGLSGEPWWY